VDDAFLVRGFEGVADLAGYMEGFVSGMGPWAIRSARVWWRLRVLAWCRWRARPRPCRLRPAWTWCG